MDGLSISLRSDDEGGAGVKDGSAALETRVLAINGEVHGALPEALLVDVVEGDESVGVELGRVETTKGDFTIVLAIGETRDLVGGDSILDEVVLCQRLDGSEGLLLGQGLYKNGQRQSPEKHNEGHLQTEPNPSSHQKLPKDVSIQTQQSQNDTY